MKKKQIRFALCLLLAAALLGGCNQKQPGGKPTFPTTVTRNPSPLVPFPSATEPTTATPETPEAPSLEPVTLLSCAKWETLPRLLSLGDGAVLVCRNDYEEGQGAVNRLQVLDVYEDRVLAQASLSGSKEPVEQQFEDGCFILKDPNTGTFFIYDRTLQLLKQFTASNCDGYFSRDRKNYYFLDNEVLYRMDVSSGNYARMNLDYELRLQRLIGVHPTQDIVVAKCYLSFFNDSTGVCAIDCKTGKYLLLNKNATHLWLDENSFYAAVTNDSLYGSDIVYGTLSDGAQNRVYTALLGSDTVSYTMLPGSGLLLHRTVDERALSTTVYDLGAGGISSRLSQYGYDTSTLGAVYLPQEQLICGVYPLEKEFLPVVINPKALRYEKSLSVNKESWPALIDRVSILDYRSQLEGPALPEQLQALRQQADTLEEKYGITILMENQATLHCNGYAQVNGDPKAIGEALKALDQALAQYPAGFLKQFQNGIGEGGLYFLLTGPVQGALKPVGKTTPVRNRYELAIDITSGQLSTTIHHELWHAIEMKLSTDSFDQRSWQAANPKGFTYYGHYDSGYQKLTQWTYQKSGSSCYFVDAYCRINPREDRARLMEYVMTGDAETLLQSKALRAKLEMMSDAIRQQFSTDGWGTPLWEQYL